MRAAGRSVQICALAVETNTSVTCNCSHMATRNSVYVSLEVAAKLGPGTWLHMSSQDSVFEHVCLLWCSSYPVSIIWGVL